MICFKSLKTLNISRWTRLLYNAPLYFTLHCILYHKLPVNFFNTYTVYLEKGTVNSKCSLASQYTVHLYNYEFHAGYQDTRFCTCSSHKIRLSLCGKWHPTILNNINFSFRVSSKTIYCGTTTYPHHYQCTYISIVIRISPDSMQNQDSQSVADHINVTSESSSSVFKWFWNSAVGNVYFIYFLASWNTAYCTQ